MEMRKLTWKRCRKRNSLRKKLMVLKKIVIALVLVAVWGVHADAVKDLPKAIVVGDSYAVLLSEYAGWDLCGKESASFDEIVSLILERDDWKTKEVHLLWGMAHRLQGTETRVVETEIELLRQLLENKGAQSIMVFGLNQMSAAFQESGARDDLRPDEAGYQRLYAQEGLTFCRDFPSSDDPLADLKGMYRREFNHVLAALSR